MKFSLLAAALVALALTACGKPNQANPAEIENYGQLTEEGTSIAEERAREGPNTGVADPSKFILKDASQEHSTDDELAEAAAKEVADAVKDATGAVKDAATEAAAGTDKDAAGAVKNAAAEVEDEFSGKAVLPGHNLDGNGNPITDGKDPTKLMH